MAQFDTGLGWSAKEEWLIDTGPSKIGSLSTVGGTDYPGQPIPYAATTAGGATNGMYICEFQTRYVSHRTYYAYTKTEGAECLFALIATGSGYGTVAISTTPNVVVSIAAVITSTGEIVDNPVTITDAWIDTATGLYCRALMAINLDYAINLNPNVPIFTSQRDALDAVTLTNQDFYKLNPGFAIACFVKWGDFAPTTYWTPFLISTDESAIKFSTDGVNEYPYTAKAIQKYDGMTFYVSYIRGIDGQPKTSLPKFDANAEFIGPGGDKLSLNNVFALIASARFANILVNESVDPYDPFGNTEEGGGEQDPNPEDDDIEEDPLPTTSFADAGFCRIYSPSLAQLDSLSNYLWTDQTFLQTVINHLKQIIENPIDAIISLSLVPCVPPTSTAEEVKVMFIPTGVYMPPVTNQFVEIDCGTFTLKEMYGSALDYNPYTSVQLYLPYVGIVQLDTDEVMGKTIQVGYRIDVVTGVCCAYVKAGGDVLYQFSGHCSIQQPITSADFSGYINAVLAAGKLVASIAAAGAGAPEVAASLVGAPAPSVSSTSSDTRTTERNTATGRQITAGTQHKETKTEHSGASFGEVAARGISNTVGAVMNSKTIVQHSGGFSGNSGYLAAVRRPYLIVTRPRIANPEQYAQFNGRPSMIYLNLGSCTGYTQVQSVHLTGIDATNPELSEIATLLTAGVIF